MGMDPVRRLRFRFPWRGGHGVFVPSSGVLPASASPKSVPTVSSATVGHLPRTRPDPHTQRAHRYGTLRVLSSP
ncbi:hypothetical protein GCM10010307_43430 [Streptomyces vastus]|uniref:DUF4236 domain-containing protein n=1 Tax=Streptomyces vastus TaxID=285451 RepID=A0ABP6DCQ8_9ACTN